MTTNYKFVVNENSWYLFSLYKCISLIHTQDNDRLYTIIVIPRNPTQFYRNNLLQCEEEKLSRKIAI